MAIMEIQDILKCMPHRFPMLLIDRIIECDHKERIVALKNVTFNEPHMQGHFPNDPIMPGVLQLEAMAQTAGVLLNQISQRPGSIALFVSIDNARFRRMIRPGDTLRIEAVFTKVRLKVALVHASIHVDGEMASEADLKFIYKEGS